jgi:general stress protein YciG
MSEHETRIGPGTSAKRLTGFALLPPERRRELASIAGKASQASGRGHRYTVEEARRYAPMGARAVRHDSEHMSRLAKLGGLKISADRAHMAAIGRLGGRKQDPERMREIGAKGGRAPKNCSNCRGAAGAGHVARWCPWRKGGRVCL